MLGKMRIIQGLVQILLRVWTIAAVYFVNNRLFSWLKETRTPRIKYHKILKSRQKQPIYNTKEQDSRVNLLTSINYSWKNLIFKNLANSRNQRDSCSQTIMFSPFKRRLFYSDINCSKDALSSSNLHLSLDGQTCDTLSVVDIEKGKILEDTGNKSCQNSSPINCEKYSTDLQSLTKNFEFVDTVSYKNYFSDSILQMENNKLYLDKLECLCPKMNSNFMQTGTYEDYICESATLEGQEKTNMEYLNKKCPYYSTELKKPDIFQRHLNNCETIQKKNKKQNMEDLSDKECVFPKEAHCNRAASIDSGFQSFHSINTTYTCLDIDDVTLYISNICYNHDGKVIAMTVSFDADKDLLEDSIFLDDEDEDSDDDECFSEDEDNCSDCEEDFIVFDTEHCDTNEQFCPNSSDEIAIAVNVGVGCSSLEVKISNTFSSLPYFCHVKVDECPIKVNSKRDKKFALGTEYVNVTKDEEDSVQIRKEKGVEVENVEAGNNIKATKDKYFLDNDKVKKDEIVIEVHNSKEGKLQVKNEHKNSIEIEKDKVENIVQNNSSAGAACSPRKKVQFKSDVEVHSIVTWEYAYRQARLGPWNELATNRAHFKRRIQDIAEIVEPVLMKKITMIAL